ncbi:partitioning defective 3 homolog isoform X2 [Parasteatoda tepidariorum]|uniref:partitioning defective 3 homolog isoform X2 n=1 Tax=Parasteatoda tepidariorum TaxID=114398 RepID=UPI001C725028|nr:partitioning defective 3 homolog isoform X2 [Parasteatoda tepidariorum]
MSDTLGRILGHAGKYSFRKAQLKSRSQSSVVTIHNLKSSRDDGILYPDDQLNDVADDREQIIAVFDENYSPIPQYSCGGDVTSTSSVYTGSPDLFSVEVGSLCSNNNVDTIEDHLPGITPLQVRRGSEPALNCLFPPISSSSTDPNNKRWSTAVVINPPEHQHDANENGVDESVSPLESLDLNGDSKMSSLSFSRSSGRLSILGNNSETHRWVEAADRQLMKDYNENFHLKSPSPEHGDEADSDTSSMSDEREKTIILKNETGPLGIHVVPDYDSSGRDTGLVIQGIEAGGRIDRDGRFRVGDRITEINGKSLQNVSFQTAQEIFKSALKSSQIKLELIRGASNHLQQSKTAAVPKKPPAPVYPRANIPSPEAPKKAEEESSLVEGEERAGGISTKVATVTPTKKIPASATRRLASANTRKIGKMLTIELTKGSAGLGFSITTRDNPAGGNSPIYIKNILPKGAAIEDGRLLPGDRLLEVNGTSMTSKTQSDAVSILRNIPLGKTVQLIVSRQEAVEPEVAEVESEPVPPKLEDESGIFPWKYREILTFQIPLNESHSAGLGVSVKGKNASTPNGSVDLGIFIKSVIPGGAASKDGRLQTNDQLVNINGISLLGMSNTNAMETLRNAMTQSDGPIRNAIILTVARRIFQPLEEENPPRPEASAASRERVNGLDLQMNTNSLDLETLQKNNPGLPGCNPVVERLTGQISSENSATDLYGYMRRGGAEKIAPSMEEYFKPNYMSSLSSNQAENVMIEGEYDPTVKKVADTPQMNGSTNNSSVAPAGSQLSLDDPNAGFERDGFGRQSMSEKRHAQLDAKNTDTYQRNKKAREEKKHYLEDDQSNPITGSDSILIHRNHQTAEALGPSLGLRKSSSLESLQTMIQELNKDDEVMKRALESGGARSSRSRGCNESFRAAVDRSYDAPAASTMDTLDEESESGSSVGHLLTRSTEFPNAHQNMDALHDDLLSMYCRNSKSSKKKSLLKGLGSVFKFGKHRKHSQDLKGKGDDDSGHEDYYHHQPSSKETDPRVTEMSREDLLKRQLPQIPSSSSDSGGMPNRQERMQSLREQHQRMHQKRQGQYPLEQKEEYYENELKEKEGNYALPFEVIHGRSHSLDIHLENPQNHSKGGAAFSDTNRYSHYMNYKEIQQHISLRGHPAATKAASVPDSKPHGTPLPELPTNFYDYSGHQLRRTGQTPELCSNSLPRGTRGSDRSLPHSQALTAKPYFLQETHDHDNYGRMNMHHPFYPNNNKLYSHIVPGSKV